MQLTEFHRQVLILSREGNGTAAIVEKLGNTNAHQVSEAKKEIAKYWVQSFRATIKYQGYVNYLRYEMLLNIAIEFMNNYEGPPDPKLLTCVAGIIDRQNKMLGIGGTDVKWQTGDSKGFDTLKEELEALTLPKKFGIAAQ